MASIHILKGPSEGMVLPLEGEKCILGRNPDCGIVIPVTSVSREHAQIVRLNGKFFIEDKQSRNGTFVNNQQISQRTPLKNNDRIRICDWVGAFLETPSSPVVVEEDDEPEGQSTVEAMLNHTSHLLLETAPAEKLRALLEISNNLSKTLQLDSLLPKIADSLFHLFRQADRCFIIQAEGERAAPVTPPPQSGDRAAATLPASSERPSSHPGTERLLPRVVKTRRPQDEANARFSRSIVRRCLETAQAFLSDDASKDDRIQLSQSVVDFRIRSVMCAPLCDAQGRAFGVIQLDTQDRAKKFTQEDLKLLCGVANTAAISMENGRLLDQAVKEERLKRDLKLAHEVQLSFLPKHLPTVPGYAFGAHYEAAQQVGGDYYGFIPLSNDRVAVTIGDVAGKGVAAALMMAKLSSDCRFTLLSQSDPCVAVALLNDLITEVTAAADRFITFALALLDPHTHELTLISAGHNSPVRYTPGSADLPDVMPRDVPGIPLGIMEGMPFDCCKCTLKPGESLLLFTDGVTESMDVKGNAFGMEGVLRAVQGAGAATPRQLVDLVNRGVRQHAAGREPHDDVTVVAVGRLA